MKRHVATFAAALIALLASGTVGRAFADDDQALKALQDYCKTSASPCREHLRIQLRRDKGESYDRTFDLLPPPVQPNMISVHPGETVRAVPIFENDTFTGWRAPRADDPADTQTLTIQLEQAPGRADMLAHVGNNTASTLKLRMGLVRIDGDNAPESTSSCPLRPGMTNFESWPYPIFVLIVAEAKRIPEAEAGLCQ